MKKLLTILNLLLIATLSGLGQESHLSMIYDFEGENFDYNIVEMVATNDSLYIISNTPNGNGKFFRLDGNGEGYKLIWEFDAVNSKPNSLMANDTVIYGTTRFSEKGGGMLFKYSIPTDSFEFIVEFDPFTVQETRVEYITDSVLWLTSFWSHTDEGSIFTIEKDGTQLTKVYNDTGVKQGQNPVDFVFHDDSIYIACYNGGGVPFLNTNGDTTYSGSIIRIKSDGTGYEKLVEGGIDKGTQPQSLLIRENKLIGLFALTGDGQEGQLFTCNLDGSELDSIGALGGRCLTRMLSTDSLIYGISSSEIFGLNPFTHEIRIYEDLKDYPEFGYDLAANPIFLNEDVYMTTQQGGPEAGGAILRWTNKAPEIVEDSTKSAQIVQEVVLSSLFSDPEGDQLTYQFEYDSDAVTVLESNGKLSVTPLSDDDVQVKITANDGWGGMTTYSLVVNSTSTAVRTPAKTDIQPTIYPNPAGSDLNFSAEVREPVKIFTLEGKLVKTYQNPGTQIDISSLKNGVYIIQYRINGVNVSEKLIKN